MSDWGSRRGGGGSSPFYAPTGRRKTSAEIISEARAAVYGAEAGEAGGSGAVRPVRTRRPFTPRDAQRTLYSERGRKKEQRPTSSGLQDVSENAEGFVINQNAKELIFGENLNTRRKACSLERLVSTKDGWSGLPKLPQLHGRSKPLHRRSTSDDGTEDAELTELAKAIEVTRPLALETSKSLIPNKPGGTETASKRKQYTHKSASLDTGARQKSSNLGEIPVLHLAVQMPNTSHAVEYKNLSILELAETLCKPGLGAESVLGLMAALQTLAEASPPANNLREVTLRALFRYIDADDVRVLVSLARLLFTLRVTGANLTTTFKLVFKIARNDKNDHFFRSTNLLELLVEGLGGAAPAAAAAGLAALRVLALEPGLRARAARAGAAHLAALHLKLLNAQKAEKAVVCGSAEWGSALFQVTGALRNLAGGGGAGEARLLVASGALPDLLLALDLHRADLDVLTNVVRCLSVVSGSVACCAWLAARGTDAVRALVAALCACAQRPQLAVRLAYVLGNLAAADDAARLNIFNEEGAMDILLTILETYTAKSERDNKVSDPDRDRQLQGCDLSDSDGCTDDVLIKTVRVVANVAVSAGGAGRGLATSCELAPRAVRALLACSRRARAPLTGADANSDLEDRDDAAAERREELAAAVLATLNNITFYRDPLAAADPLEPLMETICQEVWRWVSTDAGGAAGAAAVRALGNVTRAPPAAAHLLLHADLTALEPYFEHEELSIRCAAAGVLVNVCGVAAGSAGSGDSAAPALAGRALAVAARAGDAPPATLLARALWNALAHRPLPPPVVRDLTDALNVFIDDDTVFAACEFVKSSERRASDPEVTNQSVKLKASEDSDDPNKSHRLGRACSMEQDLNYEHDDEDVYSGEDLGFEEGEGYSCDCRCCRRLAAWEELISVAMPLLDKLKPRPLRSDASVGTE